MSFRDEKINKQRRRSWDYWTYQKTGFCLIMWYDNNCVLIGSNHTGVTGSERLKMYDLKKKVKTGTPCPDIIKNTKFSWVELICQICWLKFIELNYSEKMLIPKDNFSLLKQIPGCCTAAIVHFLGSWKRHIIPLLKFFSQIAMTLQLKEWIQGNHLDDHQRKRAFHQRQQLAELLQPRPIDGIWFDGYVH